MMPQIYDSEALKETKATTNSELEITMEGERLFNIVYHPTMLDALDLQAQARSMLQQIALDWDDEDHLMVIAHCLPILSSPLLPQVIFSEEDVSTRCDQTMLRPLVLAIRMGTTLAKGMPISLGDMVPDLSDKLLPLHDVPGVCSAPRKKIIADRLFHTSIQRIEKPSKKSSGRGKSEVQLIPDTVATIEYKTSQVFSEELFASVCRLPEGDNHGTHTMAFNWGIPAKATDVKSKLNRILIQVRH